MNTFSKSRLATFLAVSLFLLSNNVSAQGPGWVWATGSGGTGWDYGSLVAVDGMGHVYVAGTFQNDSIVFGSTTLINAGSSDIFLVKFDGSGNVIWAKRGGGPSSDVPYAITCDVDGNVVLTGQFFSNAIQIGGFILSKSGASDAFVARYDSAGNVIWAVRAGGTNMEAGRGACIDSHGNVIVAGTFSSSTITLGGHVLTNASGQDDIFLVKYNDIGIVQWARREGAYGFDGIQAMSIDAGDTFWATGYYSSPQLILGNDTLQNAGGLCSGLDCADAFFAKFDSTGNPVWAFGAGGRGWDAGTGLAVDLQGNSYMAGFYQNDTMYLGVDTLLNAGDYDCFITKINSTGQVLWTQRTGGPLDDGISEVVTDPAGNVYATGYFTSDTLLAGATLLLNEGMRDIFAVKYDSAGTVVWAVQAGNDSDDTGVSLGVYNDGLYITGGFFSPTISFGNTTLTNSGICDFYLARLATLTGLPDLGEKQRNVFIAPNPSSGLFEISFTLNGRQRIKAGLYDLKGSLISTLFTEDANAGLHTIPWDATAYPPGIYFFRLQSDSGSVVKKVVVAR